MLVLKSFIKDKLALFWQDKNHRVALRIFLLVLFFDLLVLAVKFRSLPPQLPLFYSLPWGEEELTSPVWLLFLPLLTLLLGILNFSLAVFYVQRKPLLAKILVWLTIWLNFLLGFSLIKIIFLIS